MPRKLTPLTAHDIVLATVVSYTTNPRAVAAKKNENGFYLAEEGTECVYLTPDGHSCALGRCMYAEARRAQAKDNNNAPAEDIAGLERKLKKRYRGHSGEFWHDLQNLHDQLHHWQKGQEGQVNRLSGGGREYIITTWPDIDTEALDEAIDIRRA